MNSKKEVAKKILAVCLALFTWQMVSLLVHQKILIVGPWEVFLRLFSIWRVEGFWQSIAFSFGHIAEGFFLGLLLGIILAAFAYRRSWVETLLWPWMATIKAVPVASFVVICLIWLTTRKLSVFISFLIVLPIVYQNTLTGLKGIDASLMDLSRLEDIHYFKKLRAIYLPNLASQLISTVSITAGMAWKAGIAAEIIGTPNGSIGKQLFLAKTFLDTDDLLAWTVIIVLLSMAFEKLLVYVLKKLLKTE